MRGPRILLVDDNQVFRDAAIRFINDNLRFAILSWAETGEEALKKLNQINFDLVLLDINLPGINGFETLKEIKSQNYPCKVIITSFRESDEYLSEAELNGASGYIKKSEFASKIKILFEKIFEDSNGSSVKQL